MSITPHLLKQITEKLYFAIDKCENKNLTLDKEKIKNLFVSIFNPSETDNHYYFYQWGEEKTIKNTMEKASRFVLMFCDESEWELLKKYFTNPK